MHKLKKEIAELRHYLGSDVEGLKRLSAVENIANDVRKQAAAEKERADRNQDLLDKSRSEEIAMKNDNDRLRERLLVSEESVKSRDREISELKTHIHRDDPENAECGEGVLNITNYIAAWRLFRERIKTPPIPTRNVMPQSRIDAKDDRFGGYRAYEISDIIPNLSRHNLLILGAFCAWNSILDPIVFESRNRIHFSNITNPHRDRMSKWLVRAIATESDVGEFSDTLRVYPWLESYL